MKLLDASESGAKLADRAGLYGWYVIVVMMLCQALSYMDSTLPYILVEALKADLKLTDTQIGLVTGPAFSLTYAICALPIAKISDRYVRKRVICVAIVVWSALTSVAGITRSFTTFALSRVGVAIGESTLTPAASSIITDNTTETARPIALAIYTLGAPIGGSLALALGGIVNDRYGWRIAFFLIGGAGLFLTLLVAFTVREPLRRRDKTKYDLPKGDLRSLFVNGAIRNVMLGGALTGLSVGTLTGWGPAYIMRTFSLSASATGASYGSVLGIVSIAGMLLGGIAASWFAERRPGNAFRMLTILFIIASTAQIAALIAPNYPLFLALIALSAFCVAFYSGPILSAVQTFVDPNARSFAAAVLVFCISGIGMASGTFLTGLLSDLLHPDFGVGSLRWALLILTFARFWAAGHFYMAAKAMDRMKTA